MKGYKMICRNCGTEIKEGTVCPNCGSDNTSPEPDKRYIEASVTGRYLINEEPDPASETGAPEDVTAQDNSLSEEYESVQLEEVVPVFEAPDGTMIALGGGKKKKKKTGLIIGISVTAAVLAVAAVGFFFFRDKLTHLFLGDAGYAEYLEKKSLWIFKNGLSEDDISFAAEIADTAVGGIGKDIKSAAKESSDGETAAGSSIPDFAGLVSAAVKKVPDGRSLTRSLSLNLQAGSLTDNAAVKTVIDTLNSISLNTTAARSGSTGMLSAGISNGGESLGGIEIYTDGANAALTLPGISERSVALNGKGVDVTEAKKPEPDAKELKRIGGEIARIYFDSFNSAKIEYSGNASFGMNGGDIAVKTEGGSVTITISPELFDETLSRIADKLKNDSYLIKYANEAYGMSADDWAKLFPAEIKTGCALLIEHVYNRYNEVLSTRVNLNANGVLIDSAVLSDGGDFGASVGIESSDNKLTMQAVAHSTSKIDGTAHIDLGVKGGTVGFDVDYTGVKTADWHGESALLGRFTVKPANADEFMSTVTYLLGEAAASEDVMKYIGELKNLAATLDLTLDDDTYNADISLSLGEIGTFGAKLASTLTDASVTMPQTNGELETEFNSLADDVGEWLRNTVKKVPALGALLSLSELPTDPAAEAEISEVQPVIDTAGLTGTWNVTSVGEKLVTGSGFKMQVSVAEDSVSVLMHDESDDSDYASRYPARFTVLDNGREGAYFYSDEDSLKDGGEPIGYIYATQGVFGVMYDCTIGRTSYLMKDGVGVNVNVDKTVYKRDVSIYDISGVWQGMDFSGRPYIVAITPDMLMADIFAPSELMKLTVEDGGFGVFKYDGDGNASGVMRYNEQADALYVVRDEDGADSVLIRVDDLYPQYPYLGDWTLTETNGVSIEEQAEASGITPDEAAGNLFISPFVIVIESMSATDVRSIIGGTDEGFTFDMSPITGKCTYNAGEDTFTIELSYSDEQDGETYTMKYKRGKYEF